MKRLLSIIAALTLSTVFANAASLKNYQPGYRTIDGSQLNLMVAAVNNITGNGTPAAGTFTTLTASGNFAVNTNKFTVAASSGNAVVAGTLGVTGAATLSSTLGVGATTITSAGAACLSVGPSGNTNPILRAVCSTASAATGLQVTGAAAAGGLAVAVVSSGTDENITLDAKGAGTVTINGTATGAISLSRSTNITGTLTLSNNTNNALNVGAGGVTNPAFNVDASTSSSATGLRVKSAAAAGGTALSVISSGTDENLTIDAKGSGTITLNGTGTGDIVLGRAATGLSASVTGALTARSATATPAAASAVAALSFGSDAVGLYWGTGAPSISAAKGSLYIQTDGSSTSTRLFINNGTTNWVAITTAS